MIKALSDQINNIIEGDLSFKTLIQWAQSLYESGDYKLYNAQTHSRTLITQPSNMISRAAKVIWCDFYGDDAKRLSTDFLSPYEQQELKKHGVHLWDKVIETYNNWNKVRPGTKKKNYNPNKKLPKVNHLQSDIKKLLKSLTEEQKEELKKQLIEEQNGK